LGPSLLYCQCCYRVSARAFFAATLGGAAGERASSLLRGASPLAGLGDNGADATDGARDVTTLWSRSPGGCCCRPGSRSTVPDGPWCRRVRFLAISRQEANPSPMASGGADPPRSAPRHDTGTDARRTADGSVPADTTPPHPQDASGLPDPTAAATAAGGSGASPGSASRRAEQSAVAEITTLVRTLFAYVRELRADVTTLRDPSGTFPLLTASGPQPTDPTPANTPAQRDRPRSRRSAASTSPLASRSAGAR